MKNNRSIRSYFVPPLVTTILLAGLVIVMMNSCKSGKQKSSKGKALTTEQIHEILKSSKAFVEAQHTYYVHVTRSERFAKNVKELGSREESGGVVMVMRAWNASDAVENPVTIHGYVFKSLLLAREEGQKDGFVIAAYPQDDKASPKIRPIFLSVIPDAKGGIIGMSSRDTWEIKDTSAVGKIRAMLRTERLTSSDLERFSPDKLHNSDLIEGFEKKTQ